MKLSNYPIKTLKQAPADEVARNAQLLIRAGYIHKEMAGVYDYLPLGLRVLEQIKQIVREEMNELGGHEMVMSSLQRPAVWEKTHRWDESAVDIWFKTKLQSGQELGLGWSHEEPITDMMRQFTDSYRDLPKIVYQFQTKLRNELRAKSGIMRGREFVMKDMYSYYASEAEHQSFYDSVQAAYMRVFDRVGIGESTYLTFASGGAFTQFSHEFQTLCPAGEDTIYLHRERKIAVNEEVLNDEVLNQLDLKRDELEEVKAAEVGNIFSFGQQKSEELDLFFTDEKGERRPVVLGSYGIGVSRLIGVITEKLADDKGLVWPESIAPFTHYLIGLGDEGSRRAESIYERLKSAGERVILDDRDVRAGEKFADADLLGIPHRLVMSDKTNGQIEHKLRTSDETKLIDESELLNLKK